MNEVTVSDNNAKDQGQTNALMRMAAEAGPGYRGQRRQLTFEEREALKMQFDALGIPAPKFLTDPMEWIDRQAKLFEAGDYPDKGVSVSPDHVQGLVDSFDLPVPVLIEHSDSPLELGFLTAVQSQNGELFGTVALSTEADALLKRVGANKLSIGLSSDLSAIREVSLVRSPRVATAQLYSDAICFERDWWASEAPSQNEATWQKRYEQFANDVRSKEACELVEQWIHRGQLLPAEAPYARAILASDDCVTFCENRISVGELLRKMVASRKGHSLFREQAPMPTQEAASALLLPEEVEFYQRHFPGVDLNEIAQRKMR